MTFGYIAMKKELFRSLRSGSSRSSVLESMKSVGIDVSGAGEVPAGAPPHTLFVFGDESNFGVELYAVPSDHVPASFAAMAAELHGATVLDAQDVEIERLATFVQLAWARGYSDEEVELYTEVLEEEGCLPSDEDKARVAGLLSPFHIARLADECAVPPLPFPVDRCYTLVMY